MGASEAQPKRGSKRTRDTTDKEEAEEPAVAGSSEQQQHESGWPSEAVAAGESDDDDEQEEPAPAAERMGGGGCVALALHGLHPDVSAEQWMLRLNQEAERVLAARRAQHGAGYPADRVYVADDNWCTEVVVKVLHAAGFHVRKVDLSKGTLRVLVGEGHSLLIDGVLNDTFVDTNGEEVQIDPDDDGPGPAHDPGSWRHAVAVVNSEICEQFEQRFDAKVLHLDSRGVPDKSKGYMCVILKAYVVFPCTGGEGCRGACEAA